MAVKKFVPVIAKFEKDGKIIPMKILWEDGREFDIDFIFDIRPRSYVESKQGNYRISFDYLIIKLINLAINTIT